MKQIYTNCRLFDGSDSCELQDATIVVEDGKITQVETGYFISAYANAEIHNLNGAFVMPGLINAHAHHFASGKPSKTLTGGKLQDLMLLLVHSPLGKPMLRSRGKRALTASLLSGVTCVRGVGDFSYVDVELRDKIKAGKLLGPHFIVSGPAITCPGGHGDGTFAQSAVEPEQFKHLVDERAAHGVDFIKVTVTGGVMDSEVAGEAGLLRMSEEQTRAVCERAAEKGLYVASHTEGPEGIKVNLDAGVYTIEHGSDASDEVFEQWKESGAADICTIAITYPLSVMSPEESKLPPVGQVNAQLVRDRTIKAARRCRELGIPVGIGSDAACPYVTHYDLWRDVYLYHRYVEASPAEALRTVTLGNARILKIDNTTGSIEPGKSADFIVLEPGKNPLEDLRDLAHVDKVVMAGTLIENCQTKLSRFRVPEVDALLDSLYKPQAIDSNVDELLAQFADTNRVTDNSAEADQKSFKVSDQEPVQETDQEPVQEIDQESVEPAKKNESLPQESPDSEGDEQSLHSRKLSVSVGSGSSTQALRCCIHQKAVATHERSSHEENPGSFQARKSLRRYNLRDGHPRH